MHVKPNTFCLHLCILEVTEKWLTYDWTYGCTDTLPRIHVFNVKISLFFVCAIIVTVVDSYALDIGENSACDLYFITRAFHTFPVHLRKIMLILMVMMMMMMMMLSNLILAKCGHWRVDFLSFLLGSNNDKGR